MDDNHAVIGGAKDKNGLGGKRHFCRKTEKKAHFLGSMQNQANSLLHIMQKIKKGKKGTAFDCHAWLSCLFLPS